MRRTQFAATLAAQADGKLSTVEAHVERALHHQRIALCAQAWIRLCIASQQADPHAAFNARLPFPSGQLPPVA